MAAMKQNINIIECDDLPLDIQFVNNVVAVDTEALGLNIKRDRLCLCQVGDGNDNVWLVKFDGRNYNKPNLKKVMEDPDLIKVFHYARFDISILQHYAGIKTAPVYCTKIASKLTRTYTDRHGLKSLVEEVVGVNISKEQQTSNWGAEVLTESQKHYAATDVIYLHEAKTWLDKQLNQTARTAIAQSCFEFLPTRVDLDLHDFEGDIFSHTA